MNTIGVSLCAASVQDFQLELLRHTRFYVLDGERAHASLLKHRHLWLAAVLNWPSAPDDAEAGPLLVSGLIKLRDLPTNVWSADTLFVLTRTHDDTCERARLAKEEDWGGEVQLDEDQQEIDRALGSGRQGYGRLSVW